MYKIKHISRFFVPLIEDERILPSHISMYVSLFQCWSLNQFQNPFRISRADIMRSSKIRSLATYHKCIKELHSAGFIIYSPSYDPYQGSLIELVDFENTEVFGSKLFQGQKLSKKKERSFSIPQYFEVELHFNERDLPSFEASKFYSFYESQNWKLSNKNSMHCWKAAARNWISKVEKIST